MEPAPPVALHHFRQVLAAAEDRQAVDPAVPQVLVVVHEPHGHAVAFLLLEQFFCQV